MITLARWIILLSALLAPRADRARLKEEWLGELAAVSKRGSAAALRFALGAPAGARSTREPGRLFSAIGGDIKYAWRQLIRRPSHSLAVVGCLVVGLFVCIGTFSAVESMFSGDQPGVHGRKSLTRIYVRYESAEYPSTTVQRLTSGNVTQADFEAMKAHELPATSAFSALGVEGLMPMTLRGNHGNVAAAGAFVSGDFFKALATERGPAGRLIERGDDVPNSAVAVVTEHFWRTHLDADPNAIGRPILITGMSFTVIGVAPPRFHGMRSDDVMGDDSRGTQVWIPLSMVSNWPLRPNPEAEWLVAFGKLKPGRMPAEAQSEMSVAARQIAAAFPKERGNAEFLVSPESMPPTMTTGDMAMGLFMVMLLPITVLAIGCANVANLQLARAAERARELAVRLSLGATRGQLIRLLTLETLARALVSVAMAIGLVLIAMRFAQPYFPAFLTINWRAAMFSIGLAIAVALGTGLMPAWMVLRRTAAGQLKQSAQSGGLGHTRMRASLIVAQVALSTLLVSATSLIAGAVGTMETSAPQALREQVLASFNTRAIGFSPQEARQFADTLAQRASNDGRVRGVALSETNNTRFSTTDIAGKPADMQSAPFIGISESWLDVMDLKVLTGRKLTSQDDEQSVLLSAKAAKMASPAGSALGMLLDLQVGPATTRKARVVGIVADSPTQGSPDNVWPVVYSVLPDTFRGAFVLRVRTNATDAVAADLLKLIPTIDERVSWTSLRRADEVFLEDAKFVWILAMAVGACGTIALVLSATGLFAVMSYIVMLRRREIGVRLAIGADPSRIIALVMRYAVKLVAIGAGVGLAVGIPAAFFMRTQMGEIDPTDPMVFAPAVLLLFGVGALAAAMPAIRASRVDPISTLRQE